MDLFDISYMDHHRPLFLFTLFGSNYSWKEEPDFLKGNCKSK